MEEDGNSILFFTHIMSDLEKCADYITYIDEGQIIANTSHETFLDAYSSVKGSKEDLCEELIDKMISYDIDRNGFSGLIKTKDIGSDLGLEIKPANIEDIMVYHSKRRRPTMNCQAKKDESG